MHSALEAISGLLGRIGDSGSFVTRHTVTGRALKLEVRGVGPIRLPVPASTARQLCKVAPPAHHRFKDETRIDRRVGDTWEIPRNQISIDEPRWMKTLAPELARIRRDLGLPEGCVLKAQLHNLLVYAPDQPLRGPQGPQKDQGMIGTLVVGLPSHFTGGTLVIEHRGQHRLVNGSTRDLTLIAFYADCHHEILPVRQGHRVVLTYSLSLQGEPAATLPPDRLQALTRKVQDFFAQERPSRRGTDSQQGPPDRLIYLLDYQYTRHGLGWHRLKGSDAARAAALREAALRLDCEIRLALADVPCEEEQASRHRRKRGQHDEAYEQSSSASALKDLNNNRIELRHFVGPRMPPDALDTRIDEDELCYTSAAVEPRPLQLRHEGPVGNSGSTEDHGYHRAAIVLWPRDRTFLLRAKGSPLWAIGQLARKLKSRRAAGEALTLAQRLLPFWRTLPHREDGVRELAAAVPVAVQLGNRAVAAGLLKPYALTEVRARSASQVPGLMDSYGADWCHTLLLSWRANEKGRDVPPERRLAWQGSALSALCRALCTRDAGQTLAREILSTEYAWVRGHIERVRTSASAAALRKELTRSGKPLFCLIESAVTARDSGIHGQILDLLRTSAAELMPLRLAVLRAGQRARRGEALLQLGLKPVHALCLRELTQQLQAPARARNDWSIRTPIRCTCKLCEVLKGYLEARDRVLFEWPLPQVERSHIEGTLHCSDLPVRYTTRESGRPFTLVLEKTSVLFERAAAERGAQQESLKWLRAVSTAF